MELVRMTAALVEAAEALKKAAAAMPALASSPPRLRLSQENDLPERWASRSRRSLVLTALVAGVLGATTVWLVRAPRENARPVAPRPRAEVVRAMSPRSALPASAPTPAPIASPGPVPASVAVAPATARPGSSPATSAPARSASRPAAASPRPVEKPAGKRAVRKKSSIHDEDGVLEPSFL
jgi:hypothetical protein